MSPPLFHRLLVANRGEVAVRIARACDASSGITPVFAVSEADRGAPTPGAARPCASAARALAESYLDASAGAGRQAARC
jgi:acetyl-CoA carboxylase biotin carboxylase subunit